MPAEDVTWAVLIEAPARIQPCDRPDLHAGAIAPRELEALGKQMCAALEDGICDFVLGDPHAVLILPDVSSKIHRRILVVAHSLSQGDDLLAFWLAENVLDDKRRVLGPGNLSHFRRFRR